MGIFKHCDLKIGTAICTAIAEKIGEGTSEYLALLARQPASSRDQANPKTLGRTAKEDSYHV
ncbi:hypothetical protein K504DRAFT_466272 [Pleomassaria siparia CBS 279.74]|uniref:Uncharacterized protein n=1 Tax=Pleomassaria siparia CBS 279.74 TaxID=1314801 RepID=A0A6G1JPI7_9PLEO|nr:hypothetical protein K504DRAFT_466272 [Pleomassaria siparia CBS 279.74]